MMTDLISTAATAVVTAAATDTWGATRSGIRRLFERGDPERAERAEVALAATESRVLQAGDNAHHARQAELGIWKQLLAEFVEQQPDAARQLQTFAEQRFTDQRRAVQAHNTGAALQANSGGTNIAITGAIGGNLTIPPPTP